MTISLRMSDAAFLDIVRGKTEHVSYLDDVPNFSRVPAGWILHVTQGNGSPFGMFNRNIPGSRKFSTLWVAKSGAIRMFGSLFKESWAQVDGNPEYWSIETEGFDHESLTQSQLNSLARIHRALEIASGRNYSHVVDRVGGVGIGTHSMGGTAWGGHACPGTIRAGQRDEIIRRARMVKWQSK